MEVCLLPMFLIFAASILEIDCPDLEMLVREGCKKGAPQRPEPSALSKAIAGSKAPREFCVSITFEMGFPTGSSTLCRCLTSSDEMQSILS